MKWGLLDGEKMRLRAARIRRSVPVVLQLPDGTYSEPKIVTFHDLEDGRENLALVLGDALAQSAPIVRMHSECITSDVFGSARCDCGPQLREAISLANTEGGLILYLRQEGRGSGRYNKLDAYYLQDFGMDTFVANRALNLPEEKRPYLVAAQMLFALGIAEIVTNNPNKAHQLKNCGITIQRRRPTGVYLTKSNWDYLQAKTSMLDTQSALINRLGVSHD